MNELPKRVESSTRKALVSERERNARRPKPRIGKRQFSLWSSSDKIED